MGICEIMHSEVGRQRFSSCMLCCPCLLHEQQFEKMLSEGDCYKHAFSVEKNNTLGKSSTNCVARLLAVHIKQIAKLLINTAKNVKHSKNDLVAISY